MSAPRALPSRWWVAWIALAILGVGIKLFTARYYFRDDPTTGLLIRPFPSLTSAVELTDTTGGLRILADENSFLGEDLHRAITGWLWWMPTAGLGLWVARRRLLTPGLVLVALTLGEAVLALRLGERLAAGQRVDLPVAGLLPLPLAAASAALWVLFHRAVPRWLALAALGGALVFAFLLGWGHHAGLIMPYETWIRRDP